MASSTCHVLLVVLGVVLTAQLCGCTAYVGGDGFSVEFIHRDSPKSPLHDPSLTSHDRVLAAVRRSMARASALSRSYAGGSADGGVAEIVSKPFEYLMYLNVGTPRTRVLAIVDTGSNLVWFKCGNGGFDPSSSSSYGLVGCQTDSCRVIKGNSCDANSICKYHSTYDDGSTRDGTLSLETFTFDDAPGGCVGCRERPQLQVERINFGCDTNSTGSIFVTTGHVGLGAGTNSLIGQIAAATSIGRRFSYCLAPFSASNVSSILNLGARATVNEPGAVTTPLIPSPSTSAYTILLVSVKVGNSTSAITPPKLLYPYHVVIDSGTALTILDKRLLDPIVAEVSRTVNLTRKQSPDKALDLCYDVVGTIQDSVLEKLFPHVTLEFGGGAVVTLKAKNAFVQPEPGTVCLAISASRDGVAVIGNIAQQDFHVGFDLDKAAITFAAADCSKSYPSPPASLL